jgi:hypothetical protein
MGRSLLLLVFIIAAFFELGARQQPRKPVGNQQPTTKLQKTEKELKAVDRVLNDN